MTDPTHAAIVDAIVAHGYAIVPAFLAADDIATLRAAAQAHDRAGHFLPASVGRGARRSVRGDIRGDRIRWIDLIDASPAERVLLARLDDLRVTLNRELQLGLLDLDAHHAIYSAGAGYARHVDRFRDDDARVVSLVLYLNAVWREGEGGALRLYTGDEAHVDIAPHGGTLVTFLSERFPHEVLPATRERASIAGWFRHRT